MTSQYRHRRASNPSTVFPNPLEPGEIAVNTANRQIAVGDAAAGTIGVPLPLLPIRYFDARAIYAIGDMVVNTDSLYRANAATGPGAFAPAKWDAIGGPAAGGTATPVMDGTAAVGISAKWAHEDHIHPSDAAAIAGTATPLMNGTAAVGISAKWAHEDHIHASDTSRAPLASPGFSGTPTAPTPAANDNSTKLATTAYVDAGLVTAAPFDALAYNGMQVNGAFDVNQAATSIATAGYFCDGWLVSEGGTMVMTAQQASSPGGFFPGLPNLLYAAVSTAQAAMTAGDYAILMQNIEGVRAARLGWGYANAQPLTVAFFTAHHRPGTYSVIFRNAAVNRCYAATYTQNVADTTEFKTITIPGDTAGTWRIDTGIGITILFAVACGTTYTAPVANAWQAANYLAAPGQVNAVAATTDVFRLSGLIVLPGIQAPSAARLPFIMRTSDQELIICKRYWEQDSGAGAFFSGSVTSGQPYYAAANFAVEKRIAPTLTLTNASTANFPAATGSVGGLATTSFYENRTANGTGVGIFETQWKADARL